MNFPLKFSAILTALILYSHSPTLAAEIADYSFPEKIIIEQTELTLNGLGLRTATFFSIKVYAAALYLETPSSVADSIIKSNGRKRMVLKFIRSVSAEKLRSSWRDGFAANHASVDLLSKRIAELTSFMVDVEQGDELSFDITSNGVSLEYNSSNLGLIEGADFSRAILRVWLGKHPPNEALKKGLLGR